MNKPELEKNLNIIKSEIERYVDPAVIIDVQEKLNKLTNLSGLSAECCKEAEAILGYAKRGIIERERGSDLSASILKMKIESELYEEISLYTYADRLNAAITHSQDSLRTMISLYKSELISAMK